MKTCASCCKSKPVDGFHSDRRCRDGLSAKCKSCRKADATSRYGRYYEAHRDQVLASKSAHRVENGQTCRDRTSRSNKARRDVDPMWHRLKAGATRAKKLGLYVEEFDSLDLELFWLSNGISTTRCYYTGELLGPDFHLDHMIPLSRGGAHAVDNIVPCIPRANQYKWTMTSDQYLESLSTKT